MTELSLNDLIAPATRYQKFPLVEYIKYCNEIRHRVKSLSRSEGARHQEAIKFFEKQFVDELEPLSKICQYYFHDDYNGITVQQVVDDPPDATIVTPEGKEICVEFTSARDNFLEAAVLEMSKRGIPASTSGHTSKDVYGSKRTGFGLLGYEVEAEFLDDTVEKQKNRIVIAIERKLLRDWGIKANWLCVSIPDYEFTQQGEAGLEYRQMLSTAIHDVLSAQKHNLRARNVAGLWFVGYESWLSFHPIAK